ncbi:CBS domain-containing protein [Marinilabiliaceae bacterium ANBcel2]|nr:CBS domain-containing protein [Marinilabiliaceae bacterium ANBcel2]
MLAKDLISDIIPALKTSDTAEEALSFMEAFRISHLPIVNNKTFLGLISDSDIYDLNLSKEPLGNHRLSLMTPYVYNNQHIYDVIEIAARLKLTVIPVLCEKNEYMGLITQHELIQSFNNLIAAQTPGGIIIIEVGYRDYSLSEIARIVEDSDGKILSLYVSQNNNSGTLRITIKLNLKDIKTVKSSFERFGYKITATFGEQSTIDEKIKRNYESLIKYLNI